MPEKSNILPTLTEQDLQNPAKLNMVLKLVAEQIVRLQGNGGPQTFATGPFTFNGSVSLNGGARVAGETRLTGVSDRAGNLRVLNIPVLSTYAGNATALAGGLKPGDLYCTAAGVLMRVY